jgi:hypothetical protein
MRTFHIGGTASRINEQSKQDAKSGGFAQYIGIQTVRSKTGELIAMNRSGKIAVVDDKGREKERYEVNYGARVLLEDGAPVKSNQILLEWDPYKETSHTAAVNGPDCIERCSGPHQASCFGRAVRLQRRGSHRNGVRRAHGT